MCQGGGIMTPLIALLVGLAFALGAGTTPVRAQTQAPPAAKKAPVDINSASAAELKAVKGIGDADSKKIVENRPYKSTDELVQKKVMPKATYDKIKDQIVAKKGLHQDRPADQSRPVHPHESLEDRT